MKKTIKIGLVNIGGGLGFILVGVAMLLFQVGIEGILIALPIAIISLGGILAICGLIILLGRLAARNGSEFANEVADGDKNIEILEGDERNIAINHKTSHNLRLYTGWIDLALLIFLIVMQVELVVTLAFLAVFAVRLIIFTLLRYKYSKEM